MERKVKHILLSILKTKPEATRKERDEKEKFDRE